MGELVPPLSPCSRPFHMSFSMKQLYLTPENAVVMHPMGLQISFSPVYVIRYEVGNFGGILNGWQGSFKSFGQAGPS